MASTGSHFNVQVAVSIPDDETGVRNELNGRPQKSEFDISCLYHRPIRKRDLHEFSVHYNVSNSSWMAHIKNYSGNEESQRNLISHSFAAEDEARKWAKAFSPPKMVTGSLQCFCCSAEFGNRCAAVNCKNCGVQTCKSCTREWNACMIPGTYFGRSMNSTSTSIRVCISCEWLSHAFCLALIDGEYNSAVSIYGTGNINPRCVFANIKGETMFPLHCAVLGRNLDIVKWLVDSYGCPLFKKRNSASDMLQSIQTSKSRTLLDIAMTGRPKIDILAYLVSKNMDVSDTKDPCMASRFLQTLLSPGNELLNTPGNPNSCCDSSVSTVEDACIFCYEREFDCVFVPCGHQVCCLDCGKHLTECPMCKQTCNVLKIFKR